jgi:hypothetical protein
MHCITPHSSLPNRSSRPRRTLIYEYRANDAFPIYYGEMTNLAEAKFRLIRGKPARFARFGGPRPMIPHVGKYTSPTNCKVRRRLKRRIRGQSKRTTANQVTNQRLTPGIGRGHSRLFAQ